MRYLNVAQSYYTDATALNFWHSILKCYTVYIYILLISLFCCFSDPTHTYIHSYIHTYIEYKYWIIIIECLVVSVEKPCKAPAFTCRSGRCASMAWVLDGELDCDDGSDEGYWLALVVLTSFDVTPFPLAHLHVPCCC